MSEDKVMDSTDDRLFKVRDLYCELGTYEAVGDHLGVTRERVRQLLNLGVKRGLYRMPRAADFPEFTEQAVVNDFMELGSVERVAYRHRMPVSVLADLLRYYGMTAPALEQQRERHLILQEYRSLQDQVGGALSSVKLASIRGGTKLYNRIKSAFGSFAEFRCAAGLPPTTQLHKPKHQPTTDELQRERTLILEEYRALQEKFGVPLSSTNIQAINASLNKRIREAYGSFKEFRLAAGLPPVKTGRPKGAWPKKVRLERRRRRS